MPIISIEEAGRYDAQEITIRGWLYNQRESGKLLFPIFRDGTGIIQGVCAVKESPEAFEALKGLTQESSVIVTGKIRAEKRAPGGYEIGVSSVEVLQKVSETTPFPIQLKEHGVDFLWTIAICGFERRDKRQSCVFARRPFAPPANTWTARATR